MAIALSLIVEIFDLLQRGVNWLGGVSSNQAALPDARDAGPAQAASGYRTQDASQSTSRAPHPSQPRQPSPPSRGQSQRLWGGPLRIHPTRRAARVRGGRDIVHGGRW